MPSTIVVAVRRVPRATAEVRPFAWLATVVLFVAAVAGPADPYEDLDVLLRLTEPSELVRRLAHAPRVREGEQVLPPTVQAGVALLRRAGVETFEPVGSLGETTVLRHRLVEAAWPIRARAGSPQVLSRAHEVPAGCALIATSEGVSLARCPR